MDLGTVEKNLEAGMYTSKQTFFVDAALCFDNARTFHKNNPDSVWIINFFLYISNITHDSTALHFTPL